ncbi:tax1-binding protein 3-like, transcript variant X2 [Ictidomys tridecemlineatus]|uniref:Tax1-binding protein 3-like n=1 Tax=Ictidomys tridecemlineatus TaxID=43179 RepID=I3NEB7_ICTTR|nr:tax1-binding protein 3-like isoform X2 [Ictidomys tridecemlineatus]KAG3255472.1 tax1-binding protein 3-like, transcript variant X2 [Ictidomys tridecemlineatus]
MSYILGQLVTAIMQRVEIHKMHQRKNLILGFSIGGGIDQVPSQHPFSEDKTDKSIYGNGWDMTMVTHDQARKWLTKHSEEVVRLLVRQRLLQKALQQSMLS